MWIILAFTSACLLGFYDVFKKKSLAGNAVLPVLMVNTVVCAAFFLPFILMSLCGNTQYVPLAGWHAHALVFLTAADMAYFYALSCPGAMIAIVSMARRGSVVVSFLFGALLFREKNLRSKFIDLLFVLLGMICLFVGSR